jgi:hypothetical protein
LRALGRRARALGGEERRLHPAGVAVLVAAGALALGALLNANGLRKTAEIQEQGWQRDVAVAVTDPLAAVSHAILADRPRAAVKDAIGRGEDDDLLDGFVLPTVPEPAEPPAPPPKPVVSPSRPLRVWVIGDSLVVVPGQSVLRLVGASRSMRAVGGVDGRVATGLGRPDVFNWFDHVRTQLPRLRPGVVVMSFGANDDHRYMTGLRDGVELGGFGSPTWRAEYRRRVRSMIDLVISRGAVVVWIGTPQTRSTDQSARFAVIDEVVEKEAARHPGQVHFVDTFALFRDRRGGYADYLPNANGQLIRMRSPDGVHFERPGGDRIATEVLKAFRASFRFRSSPPPPAPRP